MSESIKTINIINDEVKVVYVVEQGPPGPSGDAILDSGQEGYLLSYISGEPTWVDYRSKAIVASSAPIGQTEGELWYNDEQNTLHIYDEETWQQLSQDDGYF